MKRFAMIPLLLGLLAPAPVWAQGVWPACHVRALCAGVQPGGGRIVDCLRAHKAQLSQACYVALGRAQLDLGRHGGSQAANAAPAAGATPAASATSAADQGPDPAAVNMAPVPNTSGDSPAPQ